MFLDDNCHTITIFGFVIDKASLERVTTLLLSSRLYFVIYIL